MTEKKKKLKSLIRFHSANKINNYNRGEKKRGKNEKKKIKFPRTEKARHRSRDL